VFCLLECSLCFCSDEISKDDIKVFAAVPTKPGAEFPNATRWYDTVAAATAARYEL
jgi:elongation factor 1-beta